MQTQIKYQSGAPKKFVATRTFGLPDGSTLHKGTEVMFDGTNLSIEGGPAIRMPQFRGAEKQGWAVLEAQYDPTAADLVTKSAGIMVRPADMGNPLNQDPKSPIVTVASSAREVTTMDNYHDRATAADARSVAAKRGQIEVDSQEGVPVRSLKTSAKQRTGVMDASRAIREADSVKISAGRGRTREELLEALSEEDRADYLAQVSRAKRSYVDEEPVIQVGRVEGIQSGESEGISFTNEVGNGIGTYDAAAIFGTTETGVSESEGIRFTGMNTNKPVPRDPRRMIAKSICPGFPDSYDFDASPKKKIARLQVDFDERVDVIRAVAAAETDSDFKVLLIQEFPQAFGG